MAGELEFTSMLERIPYLGIPSFWRAPFSRDLSGVDAAVYGVPLDADIVNRPGARYGPRAIREQSCYIGAFKGFWPHDYDFRERFKLIDFSDIGFFPGDIDQAIGETSKAVAQFADAGIMTLGLGGDHLIAYPALKAHAQKHGPLSLIHFDAHTDAFEMARLNHGSMFWYAVKEGYVDPARSVQLAIRTPNATDSRFHVIGANECATLGSEAVVKRVREIVGSNKCYISLDVDGMDPAYAPGTGTPVPGGITSMMQREILWGLCGLDAVGGDVVEVSPPYDPLGNTAVLGATVAIDVLYVLGAARQHAATMPST
ncbi:MAG TPA: agmatinase [Candidatus Baltobacteraceae bacterium]|nr:agmatinase [Candidatus Baltobacteraceae bacterium]